MDVMVGAFGSEIKGSSPAVEAAIEAIKAELESVTSEKYETIEVISFREQVVAGKNYRINARAKTIDGKNKKLELKVHMSLKGTHMLLEPKLKEPTADPEE